MGDHHHKPDTIRCGCAVVQPPPRWCEVVMIGEMMAVDGGAWWRCRLRVTASVGVSGVVGGSGSGDISSEISPEKSSAAAAGDGWPEMEASGRLVGERIRVTLQNLYPMDDEPMWAADHVVAPNPSFAITIPKTANEFAIKGRKEGSSKNTYSKLLGRGLSSRSIGDSNLEFSSTVIAMNSSNLAKSFSSRMGNGAKSMTTDKDGNLKIRPPVTAEEYQQVQRKEKARTILLSALPDEHMGDFYHMIDARDIWNAIKARFGGNAKSKMMQKYLLKQKFEEFKISKEEGLDKGYEKMQKILTQMNTLKIKPEPEDEMVAILPLSTSPGSSSSKGSSKSKCSVVDDVIYSFFVNHEIDQHLVYEDLDQMNKEDFEEYDLKHQMAMLSIKVHRFEKKHGRKIKFNGSENASNNYQKYKSNEAGKDRSDSKAMVVVDGSIDWDKQTEEGNTEPRSLENFGMIAGIKIASDADSEGEVVSFDNAIPAGYSVSAGDVVAAVVSP
nr:xylulose kinase-1 [Tanacetum cinerariifolium]